MNDGSDDIRIQRYETLSRQSRSDAGKIAVVGGGRLKHFDVRLNIDCPLLHSHSPNHCAYFYFILPSSPGYVHLACERKLGSAHHDDQDYIAIPRRAQRCSEQGSLLLHQNRLRRRSTAGAHWTCRASLSHLYQPQRSKVHRRSQR